MKIQSRIRAGVDDVLSSFAKHNFISGYTVYIGYTDKTKLSEHLASNHDRLANALHRMPAMD